MQTNWIVRKCIHHNCIDHVEKSDIHFLLQRRSVHFMIWFHRNTAKILQKFRVKLNEFNQITNHQFNRRYNQQFQFFHVWMFREIDRKHESSATKFKKSICENFLFTRKYYTNDSKSFSIDDWIRQFIKRRNRFNQQFTFFDHQLWNSAQIIRTRKLCAILQWWNEEWWNRK